MTRAAFDRLLRGEPRGPAIARQIRGDRAAVAALKRWTDLARDLSRDASLGREASRAPVRD